MKRNGIVKADDVVGVKVKNAQNEDLGEVEAVMLDKHDGYVHYVVLSFGGFLGMGEKLFAMPWEIFSYDDDEDCFIINVDKEKLKNSPGFDKDHWPNMSDTTWSQGVRDYFGVRQHRNI